MCILLGHLALSAPLAGQQRSSPLIAAQSTPGLALSPQLRLEFAQEQAVPRGMKIMLFAVGGFAVGATTTAVILKHNRRPCDGCISRPFLETVTIGLGGVVGALIGGGVAASIFKREP